MNRILIVCIVFLSFPAIAQDTLKTFRLGFSLGLNRCYRYMDSQDGPSEFVKELNDAERSIFRGTIGSTLSMRLSNRLELVWGVNYTNQGYIIDTLIEAGLNDLRFNYRYLDVPIGVVYSFPLSENGFWISTMAFAPRILLSNDFQYKKNGQTAVFESNFDSSENRTGLSVIFMTGYRFMLTTNAGIDFNINLNQSILSVTSGPVGRYLNSAGLCVTVHSSF